MVDLFEEVEEGLRSERYLTVTRRLVPWGIGLLAAIIVAYGAWWAYTAWQEGNTVNAAVAYQKGVDALAGGDTTGAFAAFETAAKAGSPGYRTLALLQEGDLRLAAGKPDEAAKLYDDASKDAPNQIFADLASLKAAEALLDTAPLADEQARLTPLMGADRPYALYAKEALAMAELIGGKTDDAKKTFTALSVALGSSDDMRQRAQMAILLIDSGETQTAVQAIKIAATMPPPPPASVAPQGAPGAAPPPAAGAAP